MSGVRVVVADDSSLVRRLLSGYLQSVPDIRVIATASNGSEALELVKQLRPDVVTLDVEMPESDGVQTLEAIMYDCPTPVVLVSGVSRRAAEITLRALHMGAVDFILKYTPGVDTDPEALRREVIAKVRTAARIQVVRSVRRHVCSRAEPVLMPARGKGLVDKPGAVEGSADLPEGAVVIGASTGGPIALRELMSHLPADFDAAVIIVQHMPPTFTAVLAAQLNRHSRLRVKEAETEERLQRGLALVAPGGRHLLLGSDSRVELHSGPEIRGHRPSIDVTMQSVSQLYGSRTKGVVLTGMGDDGALGLAYVRAKGGETFAQDAGSCAVNGMPQRAIERGVVDHVAPPSEIAQLLRLSCARRRER